MDGESSSAVSLCSEGNKDSDGMAIVQFMNCIPPLHDVDDALECACLRWATIKCGENETKLDRL